MRVTVVVPCYNESEGLARFCQVLRDNLVSVTDDFEVILVDDGSKDNSLEIMETESAADVRFRYVALSRNFGKEAAMLAGLRRATGDAVALMDADLQHPPEVLGPMIRAMETGCDQVVARRTRDGEPWTRTMATRLFYLLLNRLSEVRIEDGAGDFRLLSRRAVDAVLSLSEYNRFSKGLFAWIGFPTTTINYTNVPREMGLSSWSLGKLLNYGIDGVISFNNRPLRIAIYLGIVVTTLAFGYAAWVVFAALNDNVDVPGYTTVMVGIAALGGLQLLFLGVLGEYLGRIYYETKRRPHYLVRDSSEDTNVREVVYGSESCVTAHPDRESA